MTKAAAERLPCPRGCGKTFTKKGMHGHLTLSDCTKGAAANAASTKAEETSASSASTAAPAKQPGQPAAAAARSADDEFLNY
jgi:hypothetical protein